MCESQLILRRALARDRGAGRARAPVLQAPAQHGGQARRVPMGPLAHLIRAYLRCARGPATVARAARARRAPRPARRRTAGGLARICAFAQTRKLASAPAQMLWPPQPSAGCCHTRQRWVWRTSGRRADALPEEGRARRRRAPGTAHGYDIPIAIITGRRCRAALRCIPIATTARGRAGQGREDAVFYRRRGGSV